MGEYHEATKRMQDERYQAILRDHAHQAEDNVREAVTTRRGLRLDRALTVAEQLPAANCVANGEPYFDQGSSYLIHGLKASTGDELTTEFDQLPARLERAARNKKRTERMGRFILDQHPEVAEKLLSCNSYRIFRHWLETGACRLVVAFCCKQDKLCPVCANLRAGRMVARYANRIAQVLSNDRTLTEWLWTFTVKDGSDLAERLGHLRSSLRLLSEHRRKVRNASSRNAWMPFCVTAGGVYSIEITVGKNSGQWHPHVHVYALHDASFELDGTRCYAMEEWWRQRTGDSFVVDVRPIKADERGGAVLEVLKYSSKFSSMDLPQTVKAWEVTTQGKKRQRLVSAFGCLRGVPEVDELTDEFSDEEGVYVDLAFRFDGERYQGVRGDV